MDSNDLNYKLDSDRTYRATPNLNTVLDNPQVSINNAMGMNIQDMDNDVSNAYRDVTNFNINQNYGSDFSNQVVENNSSYSQNLNSNNVNVVENNINDNNASKVSYEPTLKAKKKPRAGIVVSNEVKSMAVIIFILLLVVFVIPYIYDFFKEMDLVITD